MPLNKEQMKEYQRKRRAGLQGLVNQAEEGLQDEADLVQKPVNQVKNVNQDEPVLVNQDDIVNLPVNPVPSIEVTPSFAFPRQPGRCIRCGGRIPLSDNFCSDPHYLEHLEWLVSLKPAAIPDKRGELRSRLDAYKVEYLEAAYRQDWATCDRVNTDREPLFYELWELEKGLPPEKRYWFPARVINQGHVFKPELTKKA